MHCHQLLLFWFLLWCGVGSYAQVEGFNFAKFDTLQKAKSLHLWGTQYYIHEVRSHGKVPFLDVKGRPLGFYADTCDFCAAALEGTVAIWNQKGGHAVLNFETYGDSAVVDCRKCPRFATSLLDVKRWGYKRWFVSTGYGHGVKGYKLIPFRTIAVDAKVIPYGTVLYIPAARGIAIILANGTTVVHDGYFFAGDTGAALKGAHVDFFTGSLKGNPFKTFVRSSDKYTFSAYVVT
ncbi:MAG TPA: 3D domain-containing protein, partial [Cytophagales bacterium]|nr:3D domain-containing protein [Cytophagales bacterium]